MTIVDDDPFAEAADSRPTGRREEIITGGRYRLPHRNGEHKKGGWQRVSNLVGAFSDQFALRLWELEQMARGIRGSYDLYQEILDTDLDAMDKDARKAYINDFTERCKKVSGGAAGSEFGNDRHALVEDYHHGLPLGAITNSAARRHLSLYAAALVRNQLRALPDMQERRVLVEELEVVGTLDNVLEDLRTNLLHIGDLKTQKRFWTYLEIAAQLATYANADAMWDPVKLCWVDMPPVDKSLAFVLWMPREHPSGVPAVDVHEIDIKAGWKTARLAREVVLDRAAAKAVRNPRGWVRQAPAITPTEHYAALFASVASKAEGRALVAEVQAKGLWGPVLADVANQALRRLTSTKN